MNIYIYIYVYIYSWYFYAYFSHTVFCGSKDVDFFFPVQMPQVAVLNKGADSMGLENAKLVSGYFYNEGWMTR